MLKKINIKRFKSIRNAEVEFGTVNLLIGGNGAGKSNLLEAIGLLSASLFRGLSDADFRSKGVRITPAALMKSAFKGAELPKFLNISGELGQGVEYSVSLTSSAIETSLGFSHEKCTLDGHTVFGRGPNGSTVHGAALKRAADRQRGVWDQIRSIFDFDEKVVHSLDQLAKYAIYSPQTEFLRGRQIGDVYAPPVGLHGEGLTLAVKTYLADIARMRLKKNDRIELDLASRALGLAFAPGWARAVKVDRLPELIRSRDLAASDSESVYFVDRFMHAKRQSLSVYDSSEGSLFLLFAAILIAHRESPPMLAMDNVDSALNPKLTRSLLETIIYVATKHQNISGRGVKQIFLTSHNPTALDAFDLFNDETRIFVVSRDPDSGETLIKRLEPPPNMNRSDWVIAAAGRNLSELWISGEISGALGVNL